MRGRRELGREAACLGLGGDEFLEELRLRGERAGFGAGKQRRKFVAQGQEAGRLEPDDRRARGDVRRERGQHAARLGSRLLDEPDAEEGAAAAQRTAPPLRFDHLVARGAQHALGGGGVFGLEPAVEGIDEEHDPRPWPAARADAR